MDISTDVHPKKFVEVHGKQMAYVALGAGDPVVFLHGNPTSSYLWRNIMPYVEGQYLAIAPDLIGMGDSDKLENPGPGRYTFEEHRDYLDAFLDKIVPEGKITLVIHDWGSALGFHWAHRNPDRVKGICFMEAIVGPVKTWADWPEDARKIFQAMRSPAGEKIILKKNFFIEGILPNAVMRTLSEEEMHIYREPFLKEGEDRRPTLTWPRQIPIEGKPVNIDQIVRDYAFWIVETEFPKLFINAEPGSILLEPGRVFVRTWKNLEEITVQGTHFIQEDSPHEIGKAIKTWLSRTQ